MQTISLSSYNDINITNPVNGTNVLINNIVNIQTYKNIVSNNNLIISVNYINNSVHNLYFINIHITKPSITNNVQYYEYYDLMPSNDPYTYISANTYSIYDDIVIVYSNDNRHANFERFDGRIIPKDINNHNINITGFTFDVTMYSYSIR